MAACLLRTRSTGIVNTLGWRSITDRIRLHFRYRSRIPIHSSNVIGHDPSLRTFFDERPRIERHLKMVADRVRGEVTRETG